MNEEDIDEVEKSKRIQFGLRGYQEVATTRTDEIFASEDHNRYSAVILPTGGGKSFVAIQELLSFNNPGYTEKHRNATAKKSKDGEMRGGINDAKMLYIAPTHEILSQIKLHIVKNVLLSIPDLDKKSIAEIDQIIKEEFPSLKFQGINHQIGEGNIPIIADNASASEKKSAILRQISPKQIDALVKAAFPNLIFKCYASVKGEKANVEDEDLLNAEFIIVDEAHRLGASEWRPNFEDNIRKNSNVKILGITATPERTDKQGKDMMAEIAKMVYPGETITADQYLSQEIYVADAIKDGIVISPDITSTDASLAQSTQYKNILELYEKQKDPAVKQELEDILTEMEAIIGFSPRKLTPDEVQKRIDEEVAATISKEIRNPNGKYIAFLPANKANPKSDQEKPDSAEYFQQYMDRIREQFKGVLDENGNPVKISFEIVTSNTSIRVERGENGVIPTLNPKAPKIVNSQVIKNFEDASSETGGIKILLTNTLLNEGVHVDGIDGALMYNTIRSPITFLQQTGRCISSMDPGKPLEKQSRTQVIDTTGNTFYQITKDNGRNLSRSYDLKRIQEIAKWINDNGGKLPDINKEAPEGATDEEKVKAEYEARLAISLKRLKFRYITMKRSDSLPLENGDIVREIIKEADALELWDIDFPIRTARPSEDELTGDGFMELTSAQQRFLELYNKGYQKVNEPTPNTRVAKLLNILSVLKMHKRDIKLPQGLYFRPNHEKVKEMQSSDTQSLMLDDLLRENFDQEEIDRILLEMRDYRILDADNSGEVLQPGESYDIGKEMAFVRGKFWTSQQYFFDSGKSLFGRLFTKRENPVKYLIETGLIENPMADLEKINELNGEFLRITTGSKTIYPVKRYIDEYDRLKPDTRFGALKVGLIEEFEECSLSTGEKFFGDVRHDGTRNSGYDRFGYDKDGYDMYGYDRFGFDRERIHKVTGTTSDERGFYFDEKEGKYLNSLSHDEYDLLGYNIYGFDRIGFERPEGPKRDSFGYLKYKIPLWHQRNADGTYNVHAYEDVPAQYSADGKKSHDAHGFTSLTKTISDNPLYSPSRGKGNYFLPSGITRKPTSKNPLQEKDFYLEQRKISGNSFEVDIDGFDRNGYKIIQTEEGEKFIHRDTSSIYDTRGRVLDPKTLKPKDDHDITSTKQIIAMLLSGKDMDLDKIYSIYADLYNISQSEAQKEVARVLDRGFEIYQNHSPNAFDRDGRGFSGLDEYYTSHSLSSEKRKRIEQFFEACPRARKILEMQAERDLGILKTLEEISKLTEQEISQMRALDQKSELTDQELELLKTLRNKKNPDFMDRRRIKELEEKSKLTPQEIRELAMLEQKSELKEQERDKMRKLNKKLTSYEVLQDDDDQR